MRLSQEPMKTKTSTLFSTHQTIVVYSTFYLLRWNPFIIKKTKILSIINKRQTQFLIWKKYSKTTLKNWTKFPKRRNLLNLPSTKNQLINTGRRTIKVSMFYSRTILAIVIRYTTIRSIDWPISTPK